MIEDFEETNAGLTVLDALKRQIDPDAQQVTIEGTLRDIVYKEGQVVVGQFSEEAVRIGTDQKLHVLFGDATFPTTIDVTLSAEGVYGALQLLREKDPKLAEAFEVHVANVIAA